MRRCVTEEAKRLLEAPDKPSPARVLGLDEFSIRKGQVYDTAVVDLKHKRVIGVVSGHRQGEVAAFFDVLPESEGVEVVVMDMHEPFRQAVEMCLPGAKVVADKFHVLMHVHRALDQVRTSLQPQKGRKGELFRTRYLLLTAVERLTAERRLQLMELLGRYPPPPVGLGSEGSLPSLVSLRQPGRGRDKAGSVGELGKGTGARAISGLTPYASPLAPGDTELL